MSKLNLYLGNESEERKAALLHLAAMVCAVGHKGQPSISEMILKIADAVRYEPQRAAELTQELMNLAGEGYVIEAEEHNE